MKLKPICFIAVLLLSCISNVDANQNSRIDFLHMWAAKSEQYALASIRDEIVLGGTNWQETYVPENMRGVAEQYLLRYKAGNPPTAVQWIVDDEMRRLVSEGVFRSITDENGYFRKNLRPELAEIIMQDEELYGLPLGVHVQNHLVYNKSILDKYGLKVAKTWDELLSYGEVLAKNNIALISLSDESWQIRKLFLSILSSEITASEFDEFQVNTGHLDYLREPISKALAILFNLGNYANDDYHDKKWQEGSRLVESGGALVQVLGDYIIPEYTDSSNIVCHITPNSNYVLWVLDSIALTQTANKEELMGQSILTDIIRDPEVMSLYIIRKGGIPVTQNVVIPPTNPCIASVVNDWESSDTRIWIGGDVWRKQFALIGDYLSEKWSQPRMSGEEYADELINLLKSN